MKQFLLVFRAEPNAIGQASPEETQARLQKWIDWIAGITAQNKLVERGNRLERAGKVLRQGDIITDGPYTEIKEILMGYSLIKADSLDQATELAKGCPILKFGGNVEVREINIF